MRIPTGGPAFPTENARQTGPHSFHEEGMTLRDYFASKAMQGYIAGLSSNAEMLSVMVRVAKAKGMTSDAYVAEKAYEQADAMLKAREL